jgi:hypothetical protein
VRCLHVPTDPVSPHVTDPQPKTTTTATPTHTPMAMTPRPAPQPTTHPPLPPPPVPGHNTRPIHPNRPRHTASPDVAQPTTTTATPTHTPTARHHDWHRSPPLTMDKNPQQPLLPIPGHSTWPRHPHRFQPRKAHTSTHHQRWSQCQQGPRRASADSPPHPCPCHAAPT